MVKDLTKPIKSTFLSCEKDYALIIEKLFIENEQERKTIMEFEKIQSIIAEVMNVNENDITMDTTFIDDLGADSLDVFQIIMGIEEVFNIEIPNEEAESIVSVGDAVEQIKKATNND